MSEENTEEITVASFFERIIAFLVDLAFFEIILIISFFFILKLDLLFFQEDLMIFTYVLLFLYFACAKGKTLGKFLVGIAVVNKDGFTPLTFTQGVLRAFGYILDVLTCFGGLLLGLFNKKHRALHDFIASSMVIRTREKSAGEEIALSALATITLCTIFLSSFYIMNKAPSRFDKNKIAQAKYQLERLAYLEELHKENFGTYTKDLTRLALISGDGVQLNRDLQKAFRRKGFKIYLTKDNSAYKIEGRAKDAKNTLVFQEKI